MKQKRFFIIFISTGLLYIVLSLLIYRGKFTPIHYYSFTSMKECKEEGTFISNNLKMNIQGDSLKQVKGLNRKFFSCKSMYQQFYGFLIHVNIENKEYRRIIWEEPIGVTSRMNWVILKDGKEVGDAFYAGFLDVKIGEKIKIDIQNRKTDFKIGTINIIVE